MSDFHHRRRGVSSIVLQGLWMAGKIVFVVAHFGSVSGTRHGIIRLAMALSPGTKLGPYEIQSPLGAGGMGEVYRARDTRLNRTVAVKILPSHLSENDEAKQRFD